MLVVVGALALWAAYNLGKRQHANNAKVDNSSRKEVQGAFALSVGLKFKTVEDRDEFVKIWRPLADYVRKDEPETLSFEWLVADNDETKVLVYERYINKDAFTGVHRTSEPFLAFKAAREQLPFEIEVTGQSYIETNQGFM